MIVKLVTSLKKVWLSYLLRDDDLDVRRREFDGDRRRLMSRLSFRRLPSSESVSESFLERYWRFFWTTLDDFSKEIDESLLLLLLELWRFFFSGDATLMPAGLGDTDFFFIDLKYDLNQRKIH